MRRLPAFCYCGKDGAIADSEETENARRDLNMVFRQLTEAEKKGFARNTEAYQKYLLEDNATIEILDKLLGKNRWSALNTVEKRALWRAGYEIRGRCVLFTGEQSESKSWKALGDKDVTEDDLDAYYYTLGKSMNRG
jgi:hypothetical protein